MGKIIDYSNSVLTNEKGFQVLIKDKFDKINGFNIYEYTCPYCGELTKANISNIKRGSGCKKCEYNRIANATIKSHENYIQELLIRNPLIKVNEEYKGDSVKIKHTCSVCKKNDWMVLPTNVLQGTSICSQCNKIISNSVFAEIAQQYLYNKGLAEIEYDINYKKLSYFDLYIHNQNLLIEIQSEYHDTKLELDVKKKEFAENQGYKVEYVDIRTTDLLNFIQRFDKNASWNEILNKIDLSKMLVKKIVQLDSDGNFIKLWHGGMSEINKILSLSISRISLASRGINDKQQHYHAGFLWYLLDDYISKTFICQNVSEKQRERNDIKCKVFIYVAEKNNEQITATSAKELAEKINSNNSLVIACIKGRRKHTRGYKIIRIKDQ